MKNWLPFVVFCSIFLLLANWHIVTSTLTGLQKPQAVYEKVDNEVLSEFIRQKTGVTIESFYIVNSEALFGGMTGMLGKPVMTISKKMYESFSEDELSYIVLHETGHYVKGHSVKDVLIQLGLVVGAFLILRSVKLSPRWAISGAIMSAIILGVIVIQLARGFEWEADAFALEHLDDPQSMIRATKKLQKAWDGPADDSLIRQLFYRGIPYSERIEHARGYGE